MATREMFNCSLSFREPARFECAIGGVMFAKRPDDFRDIATEFFRHRKRLHSLQN